jgi:uncharacterized protein (TIGR02444 family)
VSRLWDDAVALYGAAGVRETLLELQDDHGCDVPLLLTLAWLDARGVPIDDARYDALATAAAAWQREVVTPLRAARRALRPDAAAPRRLGLAEAAREDLKRRVQAVELEAERHQLLRLEALAADWRGDPAGPSNWAGLARASTAARPPVTLDRLAPLTAAATTLMRAGCNGGRVT